MSSLNILCLPSWGSVVTLWWLEPKLRLKYVVEDTEVTSIRIKDNNTKRKEE